MAGLVDRIGTGYLTHHARPSVGVVARTEGPPKAGSLAGRAWQAANAISLAHWAYSAGAGLAAAVVGEIADLSIGYQVIAAVAVALIVFAGLLAWREHHAKVAAEAVRTRERGKPRPRATLPPEAMFMCLTSTNRPGKLTIRLTHAKKGAAPLGSFGCAVVDPNGVRSTASTSDRWHRAFTYPDDFRTDDYDYAPAASPIPSGEYRATIYVKRQGREDTLAVCVATVI